MPTGEHELSLLREPTTIGTSTPVTIGLMIAVATAIFTAGGAWVRLSNVEAELAAERSEHVARASKDAANDTAIALLTQKLDTISNDVHDIKVSLHNDVRPARGDGR